MSRTAYKERTYRSQRDTDLASLTVFHDLSLRAFNACKAARLDFLSDIRQFHALHGGFHKLRNCGEKTMLELEELLAKCDPGSTRSTGYKEELLTTGQLQDIYLQCFNQLGQHAKDALTAIAGPPDATVGIDLFMRHGEGLHGLEAGSSEVLKELRRMRRNLFEALDRQRHALRVAQLKSINRSMKEWMDFHGLTEKARAELFNPDGGMTLLRFMDHHLNEFDHHNSYRLLVHYLHQSGKPSSMADLAKRFGFTAERIRQILVTSEARLRKPFEVIADLPDVEKHYPELLTEGPLFMVTKDLVDGLNKRDKTQFAPVAIMHIAHAVDPQGLVIGSWSALFGSGSRSRELDNKRFFLIDPPIVEPVERMIAAWTAHMKRKRKHSESIGISDLLTHVAPKLRPRAMEAFEQLIAVRFPEMAYKGGQFILPANKMKFNDDRLLEVLQHLNKPSHVSVILEEWKRRFPEHPITGQAVINMVVHDKDTFLSIGWTSTYALRRWEKDRPEMNSGSIRAIVTQLLEKSAVPLYKEELEAGVKRFRPNATALSIIHNLKLDRSGAFRFFPGGCVGLAHKKYRHVPATPVNVPSHLLRNANLAKFIGKTRSELIDHLDSICDASTARIERVVEAAIAKGRIVLDAKQVIRGLGTKPS